jgi:4-nitrophenyl phosphatase
MSTAGDPGPQLMRRLAALRGAVLDMDGVLYRGHRAIPGSIAGLASLRSHLQLRFLTNNSTKERGRLAAQLQGQGFAIAGEDIILVVDLLERHLLAEHRSRRLLVLAEEHVRERLRQQGLTLVPPEAWRQAEVLVVGCSLTASHDLLGACLNALRAGAVFIATNPDLSVDGDDGQRLEAGAYAQMLALASGRQPLVLGKPEPPGFAWALASMGLERSVVAMIGDHPDTDIAGARRHGLLPVQVLSGIASVGSPDAELVLPDLQAFAALLERARGAAAGAG